MTIGNNLARLVLCLSAFCQLGRAAESEKRTITPADVGALESVADPHLSPDGRLIAYTYNEYDSKRSRRIGNVWIAEASGATPPRQLTSIASSSHPRWSPDGKTLAMLSSRSIGEAAAIAPRAQIFLLPMNGGEAVPLTSFPNAVTDFEWSPDGKKIACVVKSGPPRGKNASDVRHYVEPIYKFDVGGWFDDQRAHIWVIDVSTRQTVQITSGDAQEDTEPRWSPDGTKIVFVSQNKNKYPGTGGSISVVAATGGTPIRISNQDGLAHGPRWSEKGDRIAYVSTPNDWDDARIWIASPTEGGSKPAVPRLDIIPVDLEWDPNGQSILFLGMSRGTQQFYRADLTSGNITAITKGDSFVVAADIDIRGDRMAFVQADTSQVGDIFVSDLKGRGARRISHANAALYRDVQLQPAERLQFPSVDDLTVEEFLMKPVGWKPGVSYPMILCIHGGPGGMWATRFYHDFQLFAAHGWAVLYVNPRGSSGYGEKFQRAVEKEWGGKAYDDLMRGVDYALDRNPWIDRKRLGVSGASFGGFMTNWIVGHTNRFVAAVTVSSISNFTSLEGTRDMAYSHAKDFGGDLFQNFDFYVKQSPLKYADKVKTPTLVMHGDSDGRVPIEQGEQWFRALRHFGVPQSSWCFQGKITLMPRIRSIASNSPSGRFIGSRNI